MTLPAPSPTELAAPEYDPRAWALAHGICPYDGGPHQFGPGPDCLLCLIERNALLAFAKARGATTIFERNLSWHRVGEGSRGHLFAGDDLRYSVCGIGPGQPARALNEPPCRTCKLRLRYGGGRF